MVKVFSLYQTDLVREGYIEWAYGSPLSLCSRGRYRLMSLAIPSDGRGRSGSGETQARPEATGMMTKIYALVLSLNEKSFKGRKVAGHHADQK